MRKKKESRGFTIVEITIVLAIIAVISVIVMQSFSKFRDSSILNTTTDGLVSLIQEARNATLSSRADSVYGVRIEATRAVFFKGSSFSEGASTNKIVTLDSRVTATTSVSGSNIVFIRLTGATANTGTTTVSLRSNPGRNYSIYVGGAGVIERK